MEIQVPSTLVSSTSVLMGLATVNTYRFSFSACQASIPYERDMNRIYTSRNLRAHVKVKLHDVYSHRSVQVPGM